MKIWAGVSGFQYKAWVGSFYPEGTTERDMLAAYSARLPACEINNTFYRMPKRDVVARWQAQAAAGFSFVIKGSQRITHKARLKLPEAMESMAYLWQVVEPLGAQLGCVLLQTPPNLKRNDELLRDFLTSTERKCPVALELAHASWNDNAVDEMLAAAGCTRVVADKEGAETWWPRAMPWGYVRLRQAAYDDAAMNAVIRNLYERGANRAWVFFKHEETAAGPLMAEHFLSLANASSASQG